MLIASRASYKKIMGYVAIMSVMFGGTAYMVYNNFVKAPVYSEIDFAPVDWPDETPDIAEDVLAGQKMDGQDETATTPALKQAIDIADLTNNEIFKALKNIVPEAVKEKPGKKNPFEPYE